MSFEADYQQRLPNSAQLYERALRYIPGGAGSEARTARLGWTPYPPSAKQGTASRLVDLDGNEYIDYLLGLGPQILGHRHPLVTQAVADAIFEYGSCFALPYELEIEAAEKVAAAVPSVDMLRFTNSGSEAVGIAIRLARAYTGRRLIVRFEGHYHGWQDTINFSQHPDPSVAGPPGRPISVPSGIGILPEFADAIVVLSWNDASAFTDFMQAHGEDVAAVITEPAMFNAGCILPEPGYLELLRSETERQGALLIFDEVITGFRVARGGAQELFGVLPDITTLAKGLGGGFPAAAIGGRRDVMQMMGDGPFRQGGTYNGNVVCCAAVIATMDIMSEPGLFDRQIALGYRLSSELERLGRAAGLPMQVVGLGTAFQVQFADSPIRDWREAFQLTDRNTFKAWYQGMITRGVLFHPDPFECLFVSLVHTDQDVDDTLDAAADVIEEIARAI